MMLTQNIARRAAFGVRSLSAIAFTKYGAPTDVLSVTDTNVVEPTAGQLKVDIGANQVSFEDIRMIRGLSPINCSMGVAGTTGAGTVSSTPSGEGDFSKGDGVFCVGQGLWSSSAIVDKSLCVKIPKMAAEEAASIASAVSAYAMLTQFASLQKGDTVIHTNGGSALGVATKAIADKLGYNVVAASSSDLADSSAFAKKHGGAKLILTSLNGKSSSGLLKALAPKGTMVCYNGPVGSLAHQAESELPAPTASFIFSDHSVAGFDLSSWAATKPEAFASCVNEVVQMKLAFKPAAKYPQKDFLKAIKDVESSGNGAVLKL